MNKTRIGKDVKVLWSIYKTENGTRKPYDLEGRDIQLSYITSFNNQEITDFSVRGNIIEWTFWGKDQIWCAVYTLHLVENKGKKGMVTVDRSAAFQLVPRSNQENVDGSSDIVIETIELDSEVALAPSVVYVGGEGGSYDDTALWKALGNKVDKVEGKGLSSNDYTNEDKEKLASLSNYDDSALRTEIGKKVGATFVNEAIANAITNTLNTEV